MYKANLENDGTLKSVRDCYKNRQLLDESVDNYPHALEFVSECYKIQKMCDKAADTHPSIIQFVPECYKSQEMCYKANVKLKKYVT